MNDLLIPFVTGLTAGGLSCLAVQGGLLTTSVAKQLEQGMHSHQSRHDAALPAVLFLTAKLVAYTLLGALLGALGSLVELSPLALAVLQLAIGVFMVGNALRMLEVHPIFRYFVIEPPKTITRAIRQASKQGQAELATPVLLGTLTVLIPCGVTQAMMALAIGTGSPVRGAAILFAFTLGTSPLLFALAYAATRLGAQLEASFLKLVALGVFTLGLLSINFGFSALGWPLSFDGLTDAFVPASVQVSTPTQPTTAPAAPVAQPASPAGKAQELAIDVRSGGYVPNELKAKAGVPVKLSLITNRVFT